MLTPADLNANRSDHIQSNPLRCQRRCRGFWGKMTEKPQARHAQSRQAVFVRCCLNITSGTEKSLRPIPHLRRRHNGGSCLHLPH